MMTEMGTSKIVVILLSYAAVVFSQNRGDILDNEFGDFTSRFVGPTPSLSGIRRDVVGSQQKGLSPDGNFFAPGVEVVSLPDPAPFFAPATQQFGPVGNGQPLFPFGNIGGPAFDDNRDPFPFFNEGGPSPFGGDIPFIPDEGFANMGPRDLGPTEGTPFLPPRERGDFKQDDFVTDQSAVFRSSPIVRTLSSSTGSGSIRDAATRFRSSPAVNLGAGGSGDRGAEALKSISPYLKPFTENIGKRYEPMFKEFPEIFLSNEGKDSCFAKVKKVFDKSYPRLPEVERTNFPVAAPSPRLASKLPPFLSPVYAWVVENGVRYAPYKVSTSKAPIYIPFEAKTKKLLYPALPIYIPYVKISLNVPQQKRQYFPFIAFQPDKHRAPSQTCAQSPVLVPIPGSPKELFSVATFTLAALQNNQGNVSSTEIVTISYVENCNALYIHHKKLFKTNNEY